MIITFCGHADYVASERDAERLLAFLEDRVGDRPCELYLGGYGSFDAFARTCGERYRATHPNTTLVPVTPYLTDEYQKRHLEPVKHLYDSILYPPLEHVPPRYAISHRNRWMIEQADGVVAYVTHDWGGAYQAYRHAKRKEKTVFLLSDCP